MSKSDGQPDRKRQGLAIFKQSLPLISMNPENKIHYHQDTLDQLKKIDDPLNVVAVVGTLRTGKSYLLNKLGNVKKGPGFEMGHTSTAVTKGIWIMCREHPRHPEQVLVLLDTEGVDDPLKVNYEEDQWLFLLATLLCSTLVFNYRGNIDKNVLEKLRLLRKLQTSVVISDSLNEDFLLDFICPTFVLLLRDVGLNLPPNKTADDVMDDVFRLRNVADDFNEPRILLRRYFKTRKCFMFETPAGPEHLSDLMSLSVKKFNPSFLETYAKFEDYVLTREATSQKSGKPINGRMFASLVRSYVNDINEKAAPRILKAFDTMVEEENCYITEVAVAVYDKEMKTRLNTPKLTRIELIQHHLDSLEIAVEQLRKACSYSDYQICQKRTMVIFKTHLTEFMTQIDKKLYAVTDADEHLLTIKSNVGRNTNFQGSENTPNVKNLVSQFSNTAEAHGEPTPPDRKDKHKHKTVPVKGLQFRLSELHFTDEKDKQITDKAINSVNKLENQKIQEIVNLFENNLQQKNAVKTKVQYELSEADSYYQKLENDVEKTRRMQKMIKAGILVPTIPMHASPTQEFSPCKIQ